MTTLVSLPEEIERFLGSQLPLYAVSGYQIIIHPSDQIKKGNMVYTGEATPTSLEIAMGGSWQEWLEILVHETCHLDQHIESENSFALAESALARISAWLDGTSPNVDPEDFETVLENESDCEKRSVDKILRYGLPINIEDYIKKANAYLASYSVTSRHKVWIPQPYRNKHLCSLMPSDKILTSAEILSDSGKIPPVTEFLKLVSSA